MGFFHRQISGRPLIVLGVLVMTLVVGAYFLNRYNLRKIDILEGQIIESNVAKEAAVKVSQAKDQEVREISALADKRIAADEAIIEQLMDKVAANSAAMGRLSREVLALKSELPKQVEEVKKESPSTLAMSTESLVPKVYPEHVGAVVKMEGSDFKLNLPAMQASKQGLVETLGLRSINERQDKEIKHRDENINLLTKAREVDLGIKSEMQKKIEIRDEKINADANLFVQYQRKEQLLESQIKALKRSVKLGKIQVGALAVAGVAVYFATR